jgi:hypothetical protein
LRRGAGEHHKQLYCLTSGLGRGDPVVFNDIDQNGYAENEVKELTTYMDPLLMLVHFAVAGGGGALGADILTA